MRVGAERVIWIALTLGLGGCTPPTDNGNGNDNSSGPESAEIVLGATGVFGEGISGGVGGSDIFDIADQFPADEPIGATIAIDASDISAGTADDATTNSLDAIVTLLVQFASADLADACTAAAQLHFFDITIEDSVVVEVMPESSFLDGESFALMREGPFGLCIIATATTELQVTVRAMRVDFVPAGPVTADSCQEILALAEVQAAIGELSSNGIEFVMPEGADPPDVTGTYELEQTTTFDPDGSNLGDRQAGTITLSDQTDTTIRRTGFGAAVDQFIGGDAATIAFCTLERTSNPECDQTIARLESLAVGPEAG